MDRFQMKRNKNKIRLFFQEWSKKGRKKLNQLTEKLFMRKNGVFVFLFGSFLNVYAGETLFLSSELLGDFPSVLAQNSFSNPDSNPSKEEVLKQEKDPLEKESERIKVLEAFLLFRKEEYAQAQSLLEKLGLPEDPRLLIYQAYAAQKMGEWKKAHAFYQSIEILLQKDSDRGDDFSKMLSPLVYYNWGNLFLAQGDIFEARKKFDRSLEVSKNEFAPAYFNRAYTFFWEDEIEKALEDYESFLEKDGSSSEQLFAPTQNATFSSSSIRERILKLRKDEVLRKKEAQREQFLKDKKEGGTNEKALSEVRELFQEVFSSFLESLKSTVAPAEIKLLPQEKIPTERSLQESIVPEESQREQEKRNGHEESGNASFEKEPY